MVAAVAGMGARASGNSGTVDWLRPLLADRCFRHPRRAGAPGAFGPMGAAVWGAGLLGGPAEMSLVFVPVDTGAAARGSVVRHGQGGRGQIDADRYRRTAGHAG